MGDIYNSKFRSGHLITMSKRLPKFGYKNDYPGPGHYLRFSEFGILVPKDYRTRVYSANNTISTRMRTTSPETFETEANKTNKTFKKRGKTKEKS